MISLCIGFYNHMWKYSYLKIKSLTKKIMKSLEFHWAVGSMGEGISLFHEQLVQCLPNEKCFKLFDELP